MLTTNDKRALARPAEIGIPQPYTGPAPVEISPPPPAAALTLEDVWNRLLKQKWVLLLTAVSVILLTGLITWSIPPSYRAVSTLQIEKEGAQVVNFGTVTAASPDMGEQDPFFRTQYEQLKSRKLAEKVIDHQNLKQRLFKQDEPGLFAAFLQTMRHLLLGKSEQENAENPTALDYPTLFAQHLYVEPVEKTHLVKVFYESPDPELSAAVVNTLVDFFIQENINTQSNTDTYAKNFLEKEMEQARERLTLQEARLVDYAKANNILEVNNSQSSQEKKLDDLNAALAQAERSRIQAESQMRQGQQHGNVRDVLNNPVIEGIKKSLMELENTYQEQLKTFKPAYPEMQALQQQIQDMRDKLQQETRRLQQSMQSEYTAAKTLEDDLRTQLADYRNELVSLRDRSIEYNALKREVETSRNLYDGLLQRMKEVNVASRATTSNIKIVDVAAPPSEIFRPKKALNMIIGGLVGLMLGVGAALLRETLRPSGASISELQTLSGLPVLGTIPHVRNASEIGLAMATVRDMNSLLAEAYRIVTANLRFALPGGMAPRVTLLTSVSPAEGKSTSAVNIAASQAQMGLKVLLIDADLRRPTVHFKMGMANLKGLSNFLAGEVDIASVTQPSREVRGLYLVTAGTSASDPVKLLSSPAMRQLLRLAAKHFDSVIIDGPPVTGFADALYLSSMVQATVLVANENNIHRKRLVAAIGQLLRVKQNVVGFLMVKGQEDKAEHRYYDRYRQPASSGKQMAEKTPRSKRKGLNLVPGI